MRVLKTAAALVMAALVGACAHPISMSTQNVPERVESRLVQKKVAYVMSDADRAKQVTTPGGGGDKVSYFPYRDLEKSIRDVLRSVYQEVVVLNSAADANAVKESGASFVFTPEIKTTSSSPSPFTWPPTVFTTDLSCVVTNGSGVEVTKLRASGNGAAEFNEFKSDFSLAARRATDDLAKKLAQEIRSNGQLR
ncbi:hypothetical protein [Ramlibacter tataouinensis]|uniref:Lipoprotein n=1 Tax=Ramlibacter tataouinensis (strain ATCC BAA-407 / DSM 14655 / LMG 21543 / TTB310) TaxID=365046 RepID=F5Y310_RAMTT|nr:hypothetical protein [Ramlibacter tataouinensis]AEG94890.1 hypothetical protein Rta_37750 [Ramlibacter tataouinensis TTB310]